MVEDGFESVQIVLEAGEFFVRLGSVKNLLTYHDQEQVSHNQF